MKNNKIKWRKLDNSAKIFPMSTGSRYSSVFRLSVVLNSKVNSKILYKALLSTLEKYEIFKVKMKAGLFWYYLEENPKKPIIEEENNYPCKYIEPKTNNGYLFKVTYFKNKINIDIFHALTDGNGGNVFFRELVYTYLEMCHPRDLKQEIRRPRKIEYTEEDSYIKNYSKKIDTKSKSERAFELQGNKIHFAGISAIHQIIDLEQLKLECGKYDATVTQYLTAVLMYSIYNTNYKENKGKKPLKICVPVNLKKYFPSKTLSNFFSYIILSAKFKDNKLDSFDNMVEFVKKEFKEKLTEDEVLKVMSSNVKLGNNFFIKIIPLFLKNILVRIGYLEIRKHSTITYSNIGRVGILGNYQKYIKYFLMLIAPDPVEKIKCSSCTFENKVAFSFTSILNDNKIEKAFYEFLNSKGINVTIESNGVLDDISREIK